MGKLKGYRVFVTGGAHGIGAGVIKKFTEEGAKVLFCDLDTQEGERLAAETGAEFHRVDVANANDLEKTLDNIFQCHGDIDILINNVGVSEFVPLTECSLEQFNRILDINLRPVFITSRALARHRNNPEGKKRYGRIINIASTRYLQSEPDSEAYAASKGGIVSLTHALAISLSEYNITVNAISPGWIDTGNFPIQTEQDKRQHPSGRVGTPDDIALACLFLADPANDFINGQNIVIDGGMTKKMIYA